MVAVLDGAPWAGERSVGEWVARLQALGEEGPRLATGLLRAYRHGALNTVRWARLAGGSPPGPGDVDDAIRRLWDAFAAAKLVRPSAVEETATELTAAKLRRWAWQPRWYLMQQDEDLLMMADAFVPSLLAIAADRRVPKRDYLLGTVAHHARDSCCGAVYNDEPAGPTLARVAAWVPAARAAGADALAAYLERLASYAVAGPVDRKGAEQRLLDLGRCGEPTRAAIDVRAAPGGFTGKLVHSAGDRRVRIDAATGAMRLAGCETK